jgi:hypothetical protein
VSVEREEKKMFETQFKNLKSRLRLEQAEKFLQLNDGWCVAGKNIGRLSAGAIPSSEVYIHYKTLKKLEDEGVVVLGISPDGGACAKLVTD